MRNMILLTLGTLLFPQVRVCAAGDRAPDRYTPTPAAQEVAKAIGHEVRLPPNGSEGRPLPLASHWNAGTVPGTFTPDHQIGLLQQGHHILPWMSWPQGDPQSDRFQTYYEPLLKYFAQLRLPLSIRGTQWNAMLVRKEYRVQDESHWAGVIAPDGQRVARLSPFGAIDPWKDPAAAYVDTPAMRWMQETYPDPPLVLLVSNNEPPDLRWAKHGPLETVSKRYLDRFGAGHDDEFRRRVVAEGWMKRYPVMFDAMRKALASPVWRKRVRFVGYGAFGPAHLGRWADWKTYSLITQQWTDPDWYFWQGGSPSYYTNNWDESRDHWVFSTQIAAMNWLFMLDEAWQVNPDFWFEISTWDGNQVEAWMRGLGVTSPAQLADASSAGLAQPPASEQFQADCKKSKTLQYLADGQTYPPARAAGWVQFGMWLVRPRAVREFRGHATPLQAVLPYWLETVRAVDRVWNSPTLTRFWRSGRLVPNTAHRHPFQVDIPERYRALHRWYLLDTDLDPPRPWSLTTNLPVFSLALELGTPGARQWLVYAHSPLRDRAAVAIQVPDFGIVTVPVSRAGTFHVVDESTGRITQVAESP